MAATSRYAPFRSCRILARMPEIAQQMKITDPGVTDERVGSSPLSAAPPAFVPVVEVLGLIAFGRADGFTNDTLARMVERWGGLLYFTAIGNPERNILVLAIECLLARERWWRERKPPPRPLPLATGLRAALRLAWHRNGRRPFRELLPELLAYVAAYPQLLADRDTAWAQAVATFVNVAVERGITVLGREGAFRGLKLTPDPVALDLGLFANSHRVITKNNWTITDCGPFDEDGREYGDLQTRRVDLAEFVPAEKAAPAPSAPKTKPRIPPVTLRRWWADYIEQNPDPDKRPNVKAQRAAAIAAFPSHAPPLERAMQHLRAHPDTPAEWREPGRRPKSNAKSK